MNHPRVLLLATLLSAPAAACAGYTQHGLQRESARVIVPTPHPDSITISEVGHDGLGGINRWVATTPHGVFDCSIEPGEKHPICAQRHP